MQKFMYALCPCWGEVDQRGRGELAKVHTVGISTSCVSSRKCRCLCGMVGTLEPRWGVFDLVSKGLKVVVDMFGSNWGINWPYRTYLKAGRSKTLKTRQKKNLSWLQRVYHSTVPTCRKHVRLKFSPWSTSANPLTPRWSTSAQQKQTPTGVAVCLMEVPCTRSGTVERISPEATGFHW